MAGCGGWLETRPGRVEVVIGTVVVIIVVLVLIVVAVGLASFELGLCAHCRTSIGRTLVSINFHRKRINVHSNDD